MAAEAKHEILIERGIDKKKKAKKAAAEAKIKAKAAAAKAKLAAAQKAAEGKQKAEAKVSEFECQARGSGSALQEINRRVGCMWLVSPAVFERVGM